MVDISIRQSDGIATSLEPKFYDPDIEDPPRGVDLLVIQKGGVLLKSKWVEASGFIAWAPLPKLPTWVKKKLYDTYLESIK